MAGSAAPVFPPARTIAYGPDPAQVYDVRLPTGPDLRSTVVVVHGGFWRREWDRTHAAEQAQAFADAGYHVAVVEYRRVGMPGGGWPGTYEDVVAAVEAVGADRTLPDRTVLVGHSAGGHLVTLLAGSSNTAKVSSVVALAGCVDLALTRDLRLGGDAARAFMGNPADATDATHEAWTAADPAARRPTVPVVLVHGDADDVVPIDVSESYQRRVVAAQLRRVPGAGHFEPIEPGTAAFGEALGAVAELTRK